MGEKRHYDARALMSAAWHSAAFQRAKRMPPLARVIGDTERKANSTDEIVQALKMKFGVANG